MTEPVVLTPGAARLADWAAILDGAAGTLQIRLASPRQGKALLEGEGRRWEADLGPAGSAFVGLEPGQYRLRLRLGDGIVRERQIGLEGHELTTLLLGSENDLGSATGRVSEDPRRQR